MAKRVTKNPAAKRYAMMKRRISKMQRRAKGTGLIYLLGTIALAALTVMALVAGEFWTPILDVFAAEDLMTAITANVTGIAAAVLNGVLVLIVAINALKSLTKLGWLFKKKASKVYGFNRNMYAMDDLAKIFSGTFAAIVIVRFVVGMLEGGLVLNDATYLMIGAGLIIHLFFGLIAGNVSIFSTENGVEEQKREIGNFIPFLRNTVQLTVTAAILVFTMDFAADFGSTVTALVADTNGFLASEGMIGGVLLIALVLVACFMIGRATNNVEFDPEGPEAHGRGAFLFLSILVLIIAAVAYFMANAATLTIAIVALVSVIFEACTVKLPKEAKENLDEVDAGTYLSQNYVDPGVYIMPNMVQHPIQQQNILPYQGYGFELEYGMKKPAKINKR